MPPRAYVVGYLRSYAAAVGLDADEVVLRYEEAAAAVEPDARAGARRAPVTAWRDRGGGRRRRRGRGRAVADVR